MLQNELNAQDMSIWYNRPYDHTGIKVHNHTDDTKCNDYDHYNLNGENMNAIPERMNVQHTIRQQRFHPQQ